jgi:pimeloyl-ACP methyl ester carboxylesterase
LTTIAGSAHCPALDQPDALNRAVLEFVASIG